MRSPDDAPDGKYVDPLADNDVSESHINDSEPISETEPVDPQTATGNDWVTLSQGKKFTIVSEILAAMTRSGEVTVNADENWFIDALDAYWSDSPTSDTVIEMMSLSGVAGEVIESN
ncbi:hypothetical protein [Metabacillus halosaccharovorans]|uniref:hypothetical protein n=1 Tax=Metabacillus halosaccharovorans TaxID=930124 RepID=UPI00203C6139|nr:hypothetical protein [Metabacillus halosaccharovorans]MCM3443099.1 hypothetical protein [Metabacillus halosaccharovorans]